MNTKQVGVPPTTKRLPALRIENEFDLAYRPDEDFDCDELIAEDECTNDSRQGSDTLNGVAVPEPAAEKEDDSCLEVETLSLATTTLSLATTLTSVQSLIEDLELDGGKAEVSTTTISNEEWIEDFSIGSAFSLIEYSQVRHAAVDGPWEILSDEESSAVFVEKPQASYCDVIKSGCLQPTTAPTPKLRHSKSRYEADRRHTLKDIQEEDHTAFDSEFVMAGAKECRGGKEKLRFKGNQKTQRLGHIQRNRLSRLKVDKHSKR